MGRGRPSKKITTKPTFVRTGRPSSVHLYKIILYLTENIHLLYDRK
jgi:hypothetical protein